jgi:hypothetical protein
LRRSDRRRLRGAVADGTASILEGDGQRNH